MNTSFISIQANELTKTFGKTKAISNLSFQVERGNIVGFLGPNGAGKSTTMRILVGLIPASSGNAYIHGVSVARYPQKIKRMLGYMPENNPLPEDIRVIEYLRHRARLKEVPAKQQKKQIEKAIEQCDLTRAAERKIIGNLSKGYRQRVGIADCLLGNPKVIIMDEPTIGLDPHQILSFRKLIDSLRNQMTVVISSHILPEIEACCDHVIIINKGHIVAQGTSDQLRKEFVPEFTYNVSIKADVPALEAQLKSLDPELKILHIEKEDAPFVRVTFKTHQTKEFGERLTQRIHLQPNWKLREIHRINPTLEHIFIRATRQNWATPYSADN